MENPLLLREQENLKKIDENIEKANKNLKESTKPLAKKIAERLSGIINNP